MTSIDRVDNNSYSSEIHTTSVITKLVKGEWVDAVDRGDCVTVKRMARQYGAELIDTECGDGFIEMPSFIVGTALCYSSLWGMLPMTQCLIEAGADVNRASDTATPLHWASVSEHTDIVQLLLSSGAHVDAVDCDGNTALHHACEHEHPDVIRLLLQHGADYTIAKYNKQTALDCALETRDNETINAIQNAIRDREAIQPFLTQLSHPMVQTQVEKLFSNKYNNLQMKIKVQQGQLDVLKTSNETLQEQVIVIRESFERRLDEVEANYSFNEIRAQEREDSLKAENTRLAEQLHALDVNHQKLEKRYTEFRDWASSKINVSPNIEDDLNKNVTDESNKGVETKHSGDGNNLNETLPTHCSELKCMNDSTKQNAFQRLLRNARYHRLQVVARTPRDGNCFFHGVSMQLAMQGIAYSAEDLRSDVVRHMKENPEIEGRHGRVDMTETVEQDWNTYCEKMIKDKQWIDNVVVEVTAHFLKRNLHVVTSSPEITPETSLHIFGNHDNGPPPLYLGHIHEAHYESLVPIDDQSLPNDTAGLHEENLNSPSPSLYLSAVHTRGIGSNASTSNVGSSSEQSESKSVEDRDEDQQSNMSNSDNQSAASSGNLLGSIQVFAALGSDSGCGSIES